MREGEEGHSNKGKDEEKQAQDQEREAEGRISDLFTREHLRVVEEHLEDASEKNSFRKQLKQKNQQLPYSVDEEVDEARVLRCLVEKDDGKPLETRKLVSGERAADMKFECDEGTRGEGKGSEKSRWGSFRFQRMRKCRATIAMHVDSCCLNTNTHTQVSSSSSELARGGNLKNTPHDVKPRKSNES